MSNVDPKNRPPFEERIHFDRTEPVRIGVKNEWMYSERKSAVGPDGIEVRSGDICVCCPDRHIFSRASFVTSSDVPARGDYEADLASHLYRALARFGDDADLVIEIRRA
jgi:hypothetical protein